MIIINMMIKMMMIMNNYHHYHDDDQLRWVEGSIPLKGYNHQMIMIITVINTVIYNVYHTYLVPPRDSQLNPSYPSHPSHLYHHHTTPPFEMAFLEITFFGGLVTATGSIGAAPPDSGCSEFHHQLFW